MFSKTTLFITLVFLLISQAVAVQSYRDTHIENNALTSRGLAMGQSISAIQDNPDGLLLNPATMIGIERTRVAMKSQSSMADVNRLALLSIMPITPRQIVSMAYARVGVSDIKIAELDDNDLIVKEKATYGESGWLVGYAYKYDQQWSFGTTLKHYENKFEAKDDAYNDIYAAGNDLDLGVLYRYDNETLFSGGIRNLGSMLFNTGSIHWGNGYRESFDFGTFLGASKYFYNRSVLSTIDLRWSKIYKCIVGLGAEYYLTDTMQIRGGYNSLYKYSLGLGFRYVDLIVDYAYMPDFGTAVDTKHYFSVSYSFATDFLKLTPPEITVNEVLDYDNVIGNIHSTGE